jgi:hypothetical protein
LARDTDVRRDGAVEGHARDDVVRLDPPRPLRETVGVPNPEREEAEEAARAGLPLQADGLEERASPGRVRTRQRPTAQEFEVLALRRREPNGSHHASLIDARVT